MKPDKEYLTQLLWETLKIHDGFEYAPPELAKAQVSYIPTKGRPFFGLRAGPKGLAEMKKYKAKERSSIRSDCKSYLKLYKMDGKLLMVETWRDGRLRGVRLAHYEGGQRYLFHFMPEDGGMLKWGSYIIATRFEDGKVAEEFFAKRGQIVYDSYDYSHEGKIGFYHINYIPKGDFPVHCEREGYYLPDTLEYVEEKFYIWSQDEELVRQKMDEREKSRSSAAG